IAALLVAPTAAIAQSAVGNQYCDSLAAPGTPNSCDAKKAGGSGGGSSGGGSGGSTSAASARHGGAGTGPTEAAAAASDPHTGLPATGVPIVAMLGFGVALLASGMALRRVAEDTRN